AKPAAYAPTSSKPTQPAALACALNRSGGRSGNVSSWTATPPGSPTSTPTPPPPSPCAPKDRPHEPETHPQDPARRPHVPVRPRPARQLRHRPVVRTLRRHRHPLRLPVRRPERPGDLRRALPTHPRMV